MISKNLENAINEQINFEFYSAYTYLAMSAYAEEIDFPGAANFFKIQAQEELDHARKMYDYLFQKGGKVVLEAIEKPKAEFDNLLNIFEEGLKHEQTVTKRIYNIANIALDEKEHATMSFLSWFVDEQVEEEENFTNLVKKIKRASGNEANPYMIDDELATRVYTPPVPAK
ncbi:MAG: ferritin [Peptostreptococcus sp.]|nr:ferritin [Peptostreptococcus sp.]